MLTLLLLLSSALASARATDFNITSLLVPPVVSATDTSVDIECRYDANFTLLNWFKGPNEFFRYRPGVTPSTRSFPILGVGRIQMLACGPVACRLRLGALTEEATGMYRCDIERDVPPYKFNSRTAHMKVHGHEHRKPLLEGLAEEYGEDDEIQARCRGAAGSELRWYINGREMEDIRDSAVLKTRSSRLIFQGVPPTVTVQCAEFRLGKLSGSKEVKARWKDLSSRDERAQEVRSSASWRLAGVGTELLVVMCSFVLPVFVKMVRQVVL